MRRASKRPATPERTSSPSTDEENPSEGFWFCRETATRAIEFVEQNIRHWQGEFAGRPFKLEGWQKRIVGDLFGWKRVDLSEPDRKKWLRRYRYAYIEVPKGNGKSPLAAAIATLLLLWDGEPGAEVYSAAGDRRQAGIIHQDVVNSIEQNPQFAARTIPMTKKVLYPATKSFFEVLSADAPTKHGFRPHGIVFDELHVQPNRRLFDTLRLGMAKRREPLFVMITTAGVYDEESLCWQEHLYAAAVIRGLSNPDAEDAIVDDSYYAVIYAADPEDDWLDEKVWEKANPNLGVSVRVDNLREIFFHAKRNPAEQTTVKQLHLNLWAHQVQGGIDMEAWRACTLPLLVEPGSTCYVGMDLSSKLDLTSVVALFPHDDGTYSVLPFFWIPEENLLERMRRDVFDYPRYVREGFISTTNGNWVDQSAIRKKIQELSTTYRVIEVGYDSWNATQMQTWLSDEDGIEVVEMRQGTKTMSEPSKKLVGLVLDGKLRHGNHPVLNWNASNTVFRRDENDNWAPKKDKLGRKRIDGIVASLMALGRATVGTASPSEPRVWKIA